MDALLIYLAGFSAGVGTIMELVKKFTSLPETWYKAVAIVASVACAAVAVAGYGWNWGYFVVASVFLICAQFGWDFLAIKPILKKLM